MAPDVTDCWLATAKKNGGHESSPETKPVHLHLPLVVDNSIGHKHFQVGQQTQRGQGCDVTELVTFSPILLKKGEEGFSCKMRKHMRTKKKMFAF